MAPKMPSNYHSFKSSNLDLRTPTNEEAATDTADSRLKCVLVGDGAVGKTSLIVSYSTNGYPTEYVPTAYDNYSVRLKVDEQPIKLQICDTAGQDEFDEMRPLCYPGCDVILVCFSVVRPTSLSNVLAKWLPEMKKHLPKVPLVLVGTQSDLRTSVDVLVDLARYNERPVTEAEAREVAAEHGACCYVECSSLTQKHLKEVFDAAVVAALEFRVRNARKRKRSWRRRNEAWCPVKREQAQWRALAVRRKSGVWWRKLFCF